MGLLFEAHSFPADGAGSFTIATEELPIQIGGFRLHEACDDRGCWSFDSSTIAKGGAGPSTVATEELPT